MNTCQSGNQGLFLTGVEGWITQFLDAGASAVIGTMWQISDETAYQFTKKLYENLTSGSTLGEAVRQARNWCKQDNDPSWLAYIVYGQANSYIKLKASFNNNNTIYLET
jgi:CHAT domain-containing protein